MPPPCVAVAHLYAVVLAATDVSDLVPAVAAAHDPLRAAH